MSDKDTPYNWDPPIFKDAVLVDHKMEYIKKPKHYGKQTKETCTICSIINNDPTIPGYEVGRTENFIIFLNLYPYTNAHILISPIEHITEYENFNQEHLLEVSLLTQKMIKVVKHNGNTESVNIGWNQGDLAGGSIKHYHIHIIPRYPNELNFMEIVARTRPFIRSLGDTLNDLRKYLPYIKNKVGFEECIDNFS